MKVRIPDAAALVHRPAVPGSTARARRSTSCSRDLDRRYPGMRFRIVDEQGRLRKHMKVWVNADSVRDLATAIAPTDEITIMQALSGG